jgi:hypothetical protein
VPAHELRIDALVAMASNLRAAIDHLQDVRAQLVNEPGPFDRYVYDRDLEHVYVDASRALAAVQHVLTRRAEVSTLPADRCQAERSCCPDHGDTLVSGPVDTFCGMPGCDRVYAIPRYRLRPCMEPRAYTVTDEGDGLLHVCRGHAVAARAQWEDARLRAYMPVPFTEPTDLAGSGVPRTAGERDGWLLDDDEYGQSDAADFVPGFGGR